MADADRNFNEGLRNDVNKPDDCLCDNNDVQLFINKERTKDDNEESDDFYEQKDWNDDYENAKKSINTK